MQTSRKSFKAYSIAQPIKKQIDETLMKVQLQKRKFLTLEREETFLRNTLDKKRNQLRMLKAKQPQTRTHSSKTQQTNNIIGNVGRNYLQIHDNIQQLKATITTHRKQILKYKQMNEKLQSDIDNLVEQNDETNSANMVLQNENEQIKEDIMKFRQNNLKNNVEFYQSHTNINKSNAHQINQRKKFAVKQKSFLGQQFKNSKVVPFDKLSDQLRTSGIKFADQTNEIMTESGPLAKERIKTIIYKNKEKLKITENYRKFGEHLQQMFQIMKQYKGRDDLDFIAQEFVTKERQLQKIEEYIGQLQSRILNALLILKAQRNEDEKLEEEVNTKIEKPDQKYEVLQQTVRKDIQNLKKQQQSFYEWFSKVSNILLPLTEESLTRGNAPTLIGNIEQSLNIKIGEIEKKNPQKPSTLPSMDASESKQNYNELLSYQKMRELASEFVKSRKNI